MKDEVEESIQEIVRIVHQKPSDEAGPCSECSDWYRNPLNPNMVTVDKPTCPALRGHPRCVRFPIIE